MPLDDDDDKPSSVTLLAYRIRELEKRQSRLETFILGGLTMIAVAFMGGLFTLLKLPAP